MKSDQLFEKIESRLSKIEIDLAVLKWMQGVNIAGILYLVLRTIVL